MQLLIGHGAMCHCFYDIHMRKARLTCIQIFVRPFALELPSQFSISSSAMLVQTFLTHELRQLQGSAVIGAIGCVSRVYVTSVT